jgi:hypothetical protein
MQNEVRGLWKRPTRRTVHHLENFDIVDTWRVQHLSKAHTNLGAWVTEGRLFESGKRKRHDFIPQ